MFFKTMKSIENNFDDPLVNELLTKHFIELRSVSPEGSSHVLDIPGLKDPSIKFWSLWNDIFYAYRVSWFSCDDGRYYVSNNVGKISFCWTL